MVIKLLFRLMLLALTIYSCKVEQGLEGIEGQWKVKYVHLQEKDYYENVPFFSGVELDFRSCSLNGENPCQLFITVLGESFLFNYEIRNSELGQVVEIRRLEDQVNMGQTYDIIKSVLVNIYTTELISNTDLILNCNHSCRVHYQGRIYEGLKLVASTSN